MPSVSRQGSGGRCAPAFIAVCAAAAAVTGAFAQGIGARVATGVPSAAMVGLAGERVSYYACEASPLAPAAEVAAAWIRSNGELLAGSDVELRLQFSSRIAAGRLTVFMYQLFIDGLPVDGGAARVVVSSDGRSRVVLASATRTHAPPLRERSAVAVRDVDTAIAAAELGADVEPSGPASLCWLRDGDTGVARRVWRIPAEDSSGLKLTAFIDATTGDAVQIRTETVHVEVIGSVAGYATPGLRPDTPTNVPQWTGMAELLVWSAAGANTHTNETGDFAMEAQAPGTPVSSSLSAGRYASIANAAGSTLSGSALVFPGVPVDLTLNPNTDELRTAQVNAYYHTALAHEFFRTRSGFTPIDAPVPVNVNLSGMCNASFDGGALNFYRSSSGCYNSAYSTIVAHEYGHYIVSRLGLGQGTFGEGFSDALAMLLHDTAVIGAEFYRGPAMRQPGTAGRQHPCSGSSHYCGEVLAGVWWDIRQNLAATEPGGVEEARQLFVDWAQITLGGGGVNLSQSAHPLTAIEVLTVDDDDDDILNGTPHYAEISAAFALHGIECPALPGLRITYPASLPTRTAPGAARTIAFHVGTALSLPARNSGSLSYSIDGGQWQTVAAVETSPHQYACTLPAMACGQSVRFRVAARTVSGGTVTDPPSGGHATTAAVQAVIVLDDDFETDRGWSGSLPTDTASLGRWERGQPQATAAQPGFDRSPLGTRCWATQLAAGSSTSSFDVDNGTTTLTSPAIDLSQAADAIVSYWRWYSNHTASMAPNADVFEVYVTNNGITWTRVESVGPDGPEAAGGWFYREFRLSDYAAPTGSVRLRFVASDLELSSTVEAAVDDVRFEAFTCAESPCSNCVGDLDGDCSVNVGDLSQLLSQFGETGPGWSADIDPNGRVDVADLVLLLSTFGRQCDE